MPEVVSAVFSSRHDAERAVQHLFSLGVPQGAVSIVTPENGKHGNHHGDPDGPVLTATGVGGMFERVAHAIPALGSLIAGEAGRGATYVGVDMAQALAGREVVLDTLRRFHGEVGRAGANGDGGDTADPAASNGSAGDEIRIPLTEDVPQIRRVPQEKAHVGVTKRVDVVKKWVSADVTRATIETETRDVPADEEYRPDERVAELRPGETLRIALIEEDVVIQTVPRVMREVLIHARPRVERVEQEVEVRRERLEVTAEDDDELTPDEPAVSRA